MSEKLSGSNTTLTYNSSAEGGAWNMGPYSSSTGTAAAELVVAPVVPTPEVPITAPLAEAAPADPPPTEATPEPIAEATPDAAAEPVLSDAETSPLTIDPEFIAKVEEAIPPGTTVTVKRTSGDIEPDWTVKEYLPDAGRVTVHNSAQGVEKDITIGSLLEQNPDLSAALPAPPAESSPVAADEGTEAEPKAESYVAETTAGLSESDWDRINKEAKTYFERFDPQQISELRAELAELAQSTQAAREAQLAELGLGGIDASDQIKASVARAVETRTKQVVESSQPYTEDKRRAKKRVDNTRRAMTELAAMPVADFDELMRDWKVHNLDKMHAEALNEDKSFKIGEKRQGARAEIAKLNSEYGGVLDTVGNLPLDKTEGGPVDGALKAYLERQGKIEDGDAEFADGAQEVNVKKSLAEIQAHLKEQYKKEGLDDTQVEARIGENTEALKTWLQNMGPEDEPLAALEKYGRQKNFEQLLSAKRQKVAEYIGSGLLGRFIEGRPKAEAEAPLPTIDISEVLERGVDHDSSGIKAGAEALTNPDRQGSFIGRIMSQVEMARSLGRNEGLMKVPIYLIALEKGLGETFTSAWEAIPEEKKREARKKLMLKKTVASRALKALQAKAAQKARLAAERAKGGPDAS